MKIVIGSILVVFAFTYLMAGRPVEPSPAMNYLHERHREENFSVFRKSVLSTALDIAKTNQLTPMLENINRLEQFELRTNSDEVEAHTTAMETALTGEGYDLLVSQSGGGKSTRVFAITNSDNSDLNNPVVIIADSTHLHVVELNGRIEMKNLGSIRDFENIQSFIQNSKIID